MMKQCRVCKGTTIESYRGKGPGGWAKRDCTACFVGPPAPKVHPLAPWYAPTRYLPVSVGFAGNYRWGALDLWTSEWFAAVSNDDARLIAAVLEGGRHA
jgi:hypothetical protein